MYDCIYFVFCFRKFLFFKSWILVNSNLLINGIDDNFLSWKFILNLNFFFFIMNKDIIFEIGVMLYW